MNNPVSIDYQFSVQQCGRGAKKRMVEGTPKPAEPKKINGRIPRISRYMALAIHFEDLIRRGIVTDYAELARLGHDTRARITQIMNLRLLAPEIQEELLFSPSIQKGSDQPHLLDLQKVAAEFCWVQQRMCFRNEVVA